ncbi:MAG: 50S ribosomal protein L15e, partial [Candidatus Aenigmatarchaeota archaeon]
RDKWKDPKEEIPELWKERLKEWRKQPAVKRIERPTRIDRARELGYKSKEGVVVARAKIKKGTRKNPKKSGGRRTKRSGNYYNRDKSKQRIAEERTTKKFPNLRLLNSYWVAEDGKHKWFEVILVDPEHPRVKGDEDLNWICEPDEEKRALRGKTSN